MPREKKLLADVGIQNVPFPMLVLSRDNIEGQKTIANISIHARIIQEFEANWIDKFIHVLHRHRDKIGTRTLKVNIYDYMNALKATSVSINFNYPYFVEKTTPFSGEKCLVKYQCMYTARLTASSNTPKILFKIEVPVITTDPASNPDLPGGLYGQLSTIAIEVESGRNIYVENLAEMVDRHALASVYSFLTKEDQIGIITKVHEKKVSSVTLTDAIKEELTNLEGIDWFSVRCNNFSMLHSHWTQIGIEKNMGIPCSFYDFEEL
jgi:GTP cyclohydrolase FolE2